MRQVLGSAVSILGAMWIARTGINAFHAVTVAVAVVLVITSALGFASVNAKSRPGLTVFSHVCFILALVQVLVITNIGVVNVSLTITDRLQLLLHWLSIHRGPSRQSSVSCRARSPM